MDELWEEPVIRCPKCGEAMQAGRKTVTPDNQVVRHYDCPACGHVERIKEAWEGG